MERKNKACWNCWYYKAYYTKGVCRFDKEENGYCQKHKKIFDMHGLCEFWEKNNSRREIRKKVAMRKLDEILDGIIEIKQILSEDVTENRVKPI